MKISMKKAMIFLLTLVMVLGVGTAMAAYTKVEYTNNETTGSDWYLDYHYEGEGWKEPLNAAKFDLNIYTWASSSDIDIANKTSFQEFLSALVPNGTGKVWAYSTDGTNFSIPGSELPANISLDNVKEVLSNLSETVTLDSEATYYIREAKRTEKKKLDVYGNGAKIYEWEDNPESPIHSFKIRKYCYLDVEEQVNDQTAVLKLEDHKMYPGDTYTHKFTPLDSHAVSVSTGVLNGNEVTVGPLTEDTTLTVLFTTNHTLKQNADGATVKVGTETLTSQTIKNNEKVNLTIVPNANRYVTKAILTSSDFSEELTLVYDETNKGNASVEVSVNSDTRRDYTVNVETAPVISVDNTVTIDYREGVSASDVKARIGAHVTKNGVGSIFYQYDAYTDNWLDIGDKPDSYQIWWHTFGEKDTEKVKVIFTSEDKKYPNVELVINVNLTDMRVATSIELNNPTTSFVYRYNPASLDYILEALNAKLLDADGNEIAGETIDIEVDNLDVGDRKATLKFKGNDNYQASKLEASIKITAADATVTVSEVNTTYGTAYANPITVTAEAPNGADKVDYVTIVAGIDIQNGAASIKIDLPKFLLSDTILGDGREFTLGNLSELSELLDKIFEYIPTGDGTVSSIMDVLSELAKLEALENVKVSISAGKDILPKDSGVYLIAGIISDTNYETGAAINYAIIKPNAAKATLEYNFKDENFVVLLTNIGAYDFDAHIVEKDYQDKNDKIKSIFLSVDKGGNPSISMDEPKEVGLYTQITFLADLGNEMVYAAPIARPFAVVLEPVEIVFTPATGEFVYDGKAHGLAAEAKTTKPGTLTVYYTGIETDGDVYGPTTEKPTECGAYNVTATFMSEDGESAGIATTTMVIKLSDAAVIAVGNKTHIYDGKAVTVNDMVSSIPEDAARTVITGSLRVGGDFSVDGFAALEGTVNVDLPPRADELLAKVLPSGEITAAQAKDAIKDALGGLGATDSGLLGEIIDVIDRLPNNAKLTFKDNVSYSNIGVYLVIGAITDPNYKPEFGAGVLVIAPEVTEAELRWNYNDLNGIITRPVLDAYDLNATAFRTDARDDEITARIEYLIVGVDASGNPVVTSTTENLNNGVYTQVAFVRIEADASMTVVRPIMRSFVLVPRTVEVEVETKTAAYDGTPKSVNATAKYLDDTPAKNECLTLTYVGIDALQGLYSSTTPPTNVGAYMVVAEYEEYDSNVRRAANNDVKYIGAGLGMLTITPYGTFDVADETKHKYDGTEKFVDMANPAGLPFISIIVDEEKNVNVRFPSNWNIPTSVNNDIQKDAKALAEWLKTVIPASQQSSELFERLVNTLTSVSAKSLTINGKLPVEVGTYTVTCIAFGVNEGVMADRGTLIITAEDVVNPDDYNLPKTGDSSMLMLWIGMLMASGAALVVLRKKVRQN